MLKDLMIKNNLSLYECSRLTSIPYTTLSEIFRGKTSILKSSTEITYKLSKLFHVSMEEIINLSEDNRISYDVFKSNLCHSLKDKGDLDFIQFVLKNNSVEFYWNKKWYFETFYILAMLDYLCRINNIPLCTSYDNIRANKLPEPVFPTDALLVDKLIPNLDIKEDLIKKSIPEFLHFNIVESNIRDVQ